MPLNLITIIMQTNEIKLNGYTLPERVKARMILKLLETQQKELGFALCSKPDNIIVESQDVEGTSDGIVIGPSTCKNDKKFLGLYHTHPSGDSRASAIDLARCGKSKIICMGGKIDGKIRCNIWKYEQLSQEDIDNMDKLSKGIKKSATKSEISRYQQSSNCANVMGPLAFEEECVKKIDKDTYKKSSNISVLKNKYGVSENEIKEAENDLRSDIIKRDMLANKVNKEIENESKKYYNEVEIKLKKD